jgi:hypothetical protein
MANNNTPLEYVIFRSAETGLYGYKLRYVGNDRFHFTVETCWTLEEALRLADGSHERLWEKTCDGGTGVLYISRSYREGTLGWRIEQRRLTERGGKGCNVGQIAPKPQRVTIKRLIVEALEVAPQTPASLAKRLGLSSHAIACHLYRMNGKEICRIARCLYQKAA